MSQLITDLSISATTTTGLLSLSGFSRPWITLLWQFDLPSGTGTNTLTIAASVVANWEADSASEVTMPLDMSAHWRGPRIIDDSIITSASGAKYKSVSDIRNIHDFVKLTFTYGGAGTRVFRVNLWAR
jgi:hypothetical protein